MKALLVIRDGAPKRVYVEDLRDGDVIDGIINDRYDTAKPSTPSNEELTQRAGEEAIDLLCKLAQEKPGGEVWDRSRLLAQWVERAQTFVSDLPKPVDPIDPVDEALGHLEWLCGIAYNEGGAHELGYDPLNVVRTALGRTLASGGTAHE